MKRISQNEVNSTLQQHMLVDGHRTVVDLLKSKGSWFKDKLSGNEYLDFFSFFASNPLGFNHPAMHDSVIKERILEAATTKVSNSDCYTTLMAEFVDTLSKTAAPKDFPYYFFIDGGALAVENALKTAFDWKTRKNHLSDLTAWPHENDLTVLHFKHAFHGRSGYTLSLTNTDPRKTDYFPKFNWPRVTAPAIKFPLEGKNLEDVILAEKISLDKIKEEFRFDHKCIAAIIIEPIQGEGGDNHFRPEFFKELRKIADENEAMLIYDEVQTGLGMTGKWWAYQHHEVAPDIICFAKKMQVGGILVSKRVDDVEDNVFKKSSRINSTWGGSLVDMVRCTRILETIVEEKLLLNADQRGNELLKALEELQDRIPIISNARGKGLMCAIDIKDGQTRDSIIEECFKEKLIILGCGQRSIRFRPSLTINQEEIAECIKRLEKAINKGYNL